MHTHRGKLHVCNKNFKDFYSFMSYLDSDVHSLYLSPIELFMKKHLSDSLFKRLKASHLIVTDDDFLFYDINMQSPLYTEFIDCKKVK